MLNLPGLVSVTALTHRCYPFVFDMVAFNATMLQAMCFVHRVKGPPDIGSYSIGCCAAKKAYQTSVSGYFRHVVAGTLPASIDFTITATQPENNNVTIELPGMHRLDETVTAAIFAVFAEQACEWIAANVTTDRHSWPPVTNFMRVVRNAIVHGGRVNIDSVNAATVSWNGVSLGYAQRGQPVFKDNVFTVADLLPLMLDADKELAALGAPVPL